MAFLRGSYDQPAVRLSLYTAEELEPWGDRALRLERESEQVFVIANNHFEGKAVANAAMLKAGIEGEAVPVPATLFDAYPSALQGFATQA